MQKSTITEIHDTQRSIAQQLHDARICAQLTLEQVHEVTKIPIYLIDKMEIGIKPVDFTQICQLAKAYNKRVQINLIDRN